MEDENITEEELSEIMQNFTTTTEVGLEYLSNALVEKMKKNISCEFCSNELITIDDNHIHGSSFIIALSQYCEAYIRKKIEMEGGLQYAFKMKIDQMINTVFEKFKDYASEHDLFHFIERIDHYMNFIAIYVASFGKARMHYAAHKMNEKKKEGNKIRKIKQFKNM